MNAFLESPSEERFLELWREDAITAYENPGPQLVLHSFNEEIQTLADFFQELSEADVYNEDWSERMWNWALWEVYTRLNADQPVILTKEATTGLKGLGVDVSGSFEDRMNSLREFREYYTDQIGHPTSGTPHETTIRIELEQFFHALLTLSAEDVSAELKGPYKRFYRAVHGGREAVSERTESVSLQNETSVVYAYAWAKANGAYGRENRPDYWGGTHWENWKDAYATYIDESIRSEFTLEDLKPEDVEPLFDELTRSDAAPISKPVATYLMGSQWGTYVWNDVVDRFVENPEESSALLSFFFDDSEDVMERLAAFKAHTIHLVDENDRSPGSIQRMATSLLMVAHPDEHVGLPPQKTATFLTDKSTLPKFKSGFRPEQYAVIIHALRTLRNELEQALRELGSDQRMTMLDVHNVIWIYEGTGEPIEAQLPPEIGE
ncbi:hypothetical protein [Natronorarus salvus]|uniref:hypothetical protein n=1 Tax=Natronorarus salvus TaxID=3117733 RepID=UPI002F263035